MATKSNKLPDLEASLAEITSLTDKMERDELTLEQSLQHFERGITLVKHCQKILTEAEQKVLLLIQNNNQEEVLTAYSEENKSTDQNDQPQ